MAHCMKFTKAACGQMFSHYDRQKDHFGNENIDQMRTHLNYNLATHQQMEQGEFIKQRCSEVRVQNRKDVNVMCSWIVTAPKTLPESDHKQFFDETYKFLENRYGKQNVISSWVHNDEMTPHMHFAFVPVVEDKKRNGYKLSAKEAVDRKELRVFHDDLSQHLERFFGRDVGILNEATKEGNKSIAELKRQTATEKVQELNNTLSELQEATAKARKEFDDVQASLNAKKASYEAYTRYTDEAAKVCESKEIHKYVRKRFGKTEVSLPTDVWEQIFVKAQENKFIDGMRIELEKWLEQFQKTAEENIKINKELEQLKNDTYALIKENRELRNDLSKAHKKIDHVIKVFDRNPELEIEFVKTEKEMQQKRHSHDRGLSM